MAWRLTRDLRQPSSDASPVRVGGGACANVRAVRRARPRPPDPAEAIGGRRALRTKLAAPARARCSPACRSCRTGRPARAPLLRFWSPSALTGRGALSGVADPGTIPLRRFACRPRAFAGSSNRAVALAVLRCCGRKSESLSLADVRGGLFRGRRAAWARRLNGGHASRRLLVIDAGATFVIARSTTTRPTKRRRLASAARDGSCADAPLRTAFRYPSHSGPHGLIERAVPSLVSPDGAHGVQSLRRFAPACG